VELLRLYIGQDTGIYLGFNTLRRFFGFLKGTKPNSNTLDVISKYLGHENHISFERSRSNNEEWKAWRDVIKIESLTRLDDNDFSQLIELKKKHDDYYLFLSSVLKSAIHQRNFKKLDSLFRIDKLFDLEYQLVLRVSVSVSFQFRMLSEVEYNQLGELACNKSFRIHFAYLFVDYSYLDGYYGFLLDKCVEFEKQSEDRLFLILMINFRKFLLGHELKEVISDKLPMDMHPTLLGRYYGHRLLASNKDGIDEVFKLTLRAAKRSISIMSFFLEVFPQLILIKRLDFIRIVINDFYENIFDASEWQHGTEETMYLIGKSLVDISEHRQKDAQTSMSLVVLDRVTESHQDYYNLFFLIAQYHFENLKSEPNKSRMFEIESEYNEIVTRTGLVVFGGDFLKNYFIEGVTQTQ
jgi:hypothetical protein